MKQNNTTKKLALAGVLTALAIVGSFISVPVAGSKCAPVQHMVNILAAVTLGPAWGVGIAFCASLLRNLLGLGSLMAFPGSMVGALCCGLVYKKCHILSLTCLAEAIGTGQNAIRNRIPWRTCRLSGCFVSDGNCAGRTFRLCRSIPYFHCRRKHPCVHPDHSSGKRRRYVTDQRSIIIIHSYSTLL